MLTTLTRTSTLPSDSLILRVIIADGLTMPRITLRHMLARNSGCAIVGEIFDGAGAMKVVLEQRPHVLVLDLAMPRVFADPRSRSSVRPHMHPGNEIGVDRPTPIWTIHRVRNDLQDPRLRPRAASVGAYSTALMR